MMEPKKESDLREAINRRRATRRETLKIKPVQSDSNETDVQQAGVPPADSETSFTNTKTLLESLKERRLKRRGQLPPLDHNSPTSSPPSLTLGTQSRPDTAESAVSSDQGSNLRERLRQRIQKKQDEEKTRGTSLSGTEFDPPPRRKLRGLRDQPKVTRFDEPLTDEPLTRYPLEGDSIERVNKAKKKALYKSSTVEELKQRQAHVIDQEAYDFFTSEIEDYSFPDTSSPSTQPPVSEVEESGQTLESENADAVALREQLLQQLQSEEEEPTDEEDTPIIKNQSNDDYRDLLLPAYARYTPYRERLSWEDKAFFTPSTTPVSAEQKTPDSGPPHYIEDEGLYVGERPHVLWTNQVAMENRLLRREDKGWFGEDGLLLVQPNPLSKIRTRPAILQYSGDENVTFRHAKYELNNQKLINKGSDDAEYQLEVDLSSLHFNHHPFFSCEHVLASKLQQTCRQYTKKRKNKESEYYYEKMQGLRQAVIDLKQALQNETEDQSAIEEIHGHLLDYRRELRIVREKRKETLATEYGLLKTILKTWQDIKALRDNQGYSSTTAWIIVRRLATNAVDEEAVLRREIETELYELKELHEQENTEKIATYQREVADWKTYEKARRRALRQATRIQQQQTIDQATEQSVVDGSQTSLDDPMTSVPPEIPRPNPPPVFNEGEMRADLFEYYRTYHKPPGEPLLLPEFRHNHAISQQIPRPEHQRREEIGRIKFHVRVLFNNQLVSQTKDSAVNSDFTGDFNESFSLKIVQWPESIKLQIYESGLISSTLISEVYIPIPDPLQTVESGGEHEPYQFSSTKEVEYGHTAVGSGHAHPALPEEGILVTSGVVKVGVYWGVDDDGKTLCPPGLTQPTGFNSDAISSLGMTGIADLQEVKKWIERSRLDPNDPRNAELLHLVESIPSTNDLENYFRLVDVDQSLRFVSEEVFNGNRRFAVLRSRDDGHPGLKNNSIPIDSRWISESEWRAVINYKPYADYDIPLLLFGDFHSIRKAEQNKFLIDVRERVLSKARSGKEDLSLEDVVRSFVVPDISSIRAVMTDLVSPRRPLNPVRVMRRKPKRLNAHVSDARIVVRVVRALNVPTRTTQQSAGVLTHPLSVLAPPRPTAPLSPNPTGETLGTRPTPSGVLPTGLELADPPGLQTTLNANELKVVCPYVEIGFRGSVMRTGTAYGPQPFWNEEVSVPFQPPNDDFSPLALQKISDVLHVSLFDEVVTDILQDDRQRSTNIHHRIEKKWLGSFNLPFSTLHQRERVEGMFRVEVPVVLLGYSRISEEMCSHTHLQLFVSLEPTLSVLPPLKDKFESQEDPHLLKISQSWIKKLKEKYPKRNYIATALDVSGNHVFVTRFVKAQNPPEELIPPQDVKMTIASMERLAHYVSLIPYLSDALTFSGECDIWNTSDQFLHMLAGDEEEHALLLCNYFLYCGLKAWVVVGHAIPEGSTTYVLTEHPEKDKKFLLWNPSNGHHYLHDEAHNPLKSVGCVINQHNVWANMQEHDEPAKVDFDFTKSKLWETLFPSSSQPLDSVQQELVYCETDIGRVRDLQERIERTIHDHITTLRDRFITKWNRHCTHLLHSLLPRLEENFSSPLLHEHHTELDEITASHKLTGFPIHSPYVDAQHLVATVERTGVHFCEDRHVEFALAVYVHPYPNDIVSIWLYIASLVPK